MISESASEQSNMSLSPPPTTRPIKLSNKIKAHNKATTKMSHKQLDGQHLEDKDDHHSSTTNSNVKKKFKSKFIASQHNEDDEDDIDDNDDDDDDDGVIHNEALGHRATKPCNNDSQLSVQNYNPNNKATKHKSNKTETSKQQKLSDNVDQSISHKKKFPISGAISNSTNSPPKRIKKEKKRYQESVIDGFTITAFRTWEDLQDEMNERISANILRNANNDSEMPNTSCSSVDTSSSTANTDQTSNATTSLLQSKQSPSSSGIATFKATTEVQKNLNDQSNDAGQQGQQRHHVEGSSNNDNQGDKKNFNLKERRVEPQQSLLHRTLRQSDDIASKQQNHDKSHRRIEEYHNIKLQSTIDAPLASEATRHYPMSSANSGYPFGGNNNHEQYKSSRYNDIDSKRSNKPQFDSARATHASQLATSDNYPRRTPSPQTQQSPTAQQYFQQQYHQLYQQMHNSAQLHHQPPSHLQNPYLALINHPQGAHFKGPGLPPPLPPPPSMPISGPGSMMAHSPFSSPYTITDTIISRQTSIIPSSALPHMSGSLEHLANSRYARHPHLGSLEHPMVSAATSQHPLSGGYVPSPTERSFMEFARSYANASNMSSGYTNFLNHGMPKSTINQPSFYGHIERMTMDQQHRAMVQGFGAGGPSPFPGFNPVGRPPTISMFPPQYYP